MPPAQPQVHRPVTRAKNVNQHPGQIILESQQKRRNTDEMAKVRAQEQLDRELTEQHICAALKSVARVQDQQQVEDDKDKRPIVAPSLQQHDTMIQPHHIVPSMANDAIGTDEDDSGQEAAMGEGDTERDEWVDDSVEDGGDSKSKSDSDGIQVADEEEEELCPKKKKKKGKGMHAVIDSLRKCYVTAGTFTRLGLCRLPYDKALVSRVLSISHDK
jgi:hypothetical protein